MEAQENNKKAIECIERLIDDSGLYGNPTLTEDAVSSLMFAIGAIKKQIPKKPFKRMMKLGQIDVCPVCGVDTPNPREVEPWEWYCPDCGQAIDWSSKV